METSVIAGWSDFLVAAAGVLAALAGLVFIPGGFLWIGVGVVLSVLSAILNAWVLLVEIMR